MKKNADRLGISFITIAIIINVAIAIKLISL